MEQGSPECRLEGGKCLRSQSSQIHPLGGYRTYTCRLHWAKGSWSQTALWTFRVFYEPVSTWDREQGEVVGWLLGIVTVYNQATSSEKKIFFLFPLPSCPGSHPRTGFSSPKPQRPEIMCTAGRCCQGGLCRGGSCMVTSWVCVVHYA